MIRKLLAASAAMAALQASAWAADTIKVGVTSVDAGPFSFFMAHYTETAKVAVDALNAQGGALGRKYELVLQAHAGTPAAAVAAATRLVQQEGTSFLMGFNSSAMALAVGPKLAGLNAILIDASSTGDDQTGKSCQSNYFRTAGSDGMMMNVLRDVIKKSGGKTWNMIVPDYAMGHDFSKRFNGLIQEQGGTVQTTVFAQMGTNDFGSHITQLSAKPADGLAVIVTGSDGITFAKQQKQFGLFDKFKTVVSASFTNDIAIGAQGDTTVGTYSVQGYSPEMPGDKNAAFVKLFEARNKRPPSFIEADTYLSFEVLHAAIVKAGSTDVAAVRKALAGLKASTIVGDVEMRAADHQLMRPMALVQVEKIGEGKAKLALRTIEPAAALVTPVSPECKL
jgi:ABC-type branched-subunit amino acid transport system substrate-binding protein